MALAVVQTVFAQGSNVTSITTAAITTTSNNLLVANAAWYSSATATVSDSKTNTWVDVVILGPIVTSVGRLKQAYAKNCVGGASHTFTLTPAASDYPTIAVTEISGADTTSPLDVTASQLEASTTSHSSSATATTTQANEIAMGSASTTVNGFTQSATGGYTEDVNSTVSPYESLLCAHLTVSSTGAQTFTWTTNTGVASATIVATYKAAAAAFFGGDEGAIWYIPVEAA